MVLSQLTTWIHEYRILFDILVYTLVVVLVHFQRIHPNECKHNLDPQPRGFRKDWRRIDNEYSVQTHFSKSVDSMAVAILHLTTTNSSDINIISLFLKGMDKIVESAVEEILPFPGDLINLSPRHKNIEALK